MEVKKINYDDINDFPPIIYKYRSWVDKFHKEIITDQIVFMAKPTSFEDELDCKLQKRYDLISKAEIFDHYFQESKKTNPNWTRQQHRQFAREWFKKSPMHDKEYIKKLQKDHFQMFDERFGILSLTANCSNIAMWDKYSDNHRGLCIGFHAKEMFRYLGGGGEVAYYDVLQDIMPNDDIHEERFKQIFSKEMKWSFEEEYRTHRFYPHPASVDDRRINIPKECYKEIIFGSNMPNEHRQEIISICSDQGLDVNFLIEIISDNVVTVDKMPSP